jgi:hypothetical protein
MREHARAFHDALKRRGGTDAMRAKQQVHAARGAKLPAGRR